MRLQIDKQDETQALAQLGRTHQRLYYAIYRAAKRGKPCPEPMALAQSTGDPAVPKLIKEHINKLERAGLIDCARDEHRTIIHVRVLGLTCSAPFLARRTIDRRAVSVRAQQLNQWSGSLPARPGQKEIDQRLTGEGPIYSGRPLWLPAQVLYLAMLAPWDTMDQISAVVGRQPYRCDAKARELNLRYRGTGMTRAGTRRTISAELSQPNPRTAQILAGIKVDQADIQLGAACRAWYERGHGHDRCLWIDGEPWHGPWSYCPAPRESGGPWCAAHRARVYQAPPDTEKDS